MTRLLIMVFVITGYCNASCGKPINHSAYAIMANGERTHEGAIACPFWMPLGSSVFVKGRRLECKDRGGAIRGNRLDIWFPSCEEALEWGRRKLSAKIIILGGRR